MPWLRRGAAKAITWDGYPGRDDARPVGDRESPSGARHACRRRPDGQPGGCSPTASRSIELVGPGDIRAALPETAIDAPDPGSPTTPVSFGHVEFYEEDLPWRYTPAWPLPRLVKAGQARPCSASGAGAVRPGARRHEAWRTSADRARAPC